jgi:hypothetical protein
LGEGALDSARLLSGAKERRPLRMAEAIVVVAFVPDVAARAMPDRAGRILDPNGTDPPRCVASLATTERCAVAFASTQRSPNGATPFVSRGPVVAKPIRMSGDVERITPWWSGSFMRWGTGLAVIAVVICRTGSAQTAELLGAVSLGGLVGAIALYGASLAVAAARWQTLLVAVGIRAPFRVVVRALLTGKFFDNFLPSSIGGDVVRVVTLASSTGRAPDVFASVFLDRLLGLIPIVAAAAITATCSDLAVPPLAQQVIAGSAGATALALGLLLSSAGRRALTALAMRLPWTTLSRPMGKFVDACGRVRLTSRLMLLAISLGIAMQALQMLVYIHLGEVLGLDASPAFWIVLYATVTLGSLAPISVGGLGVREVLAAVLFTAAGLPASAGVAATLLWTGISSTWALTGGVVFAVSRLQQRPVSTPNLPRPS